MNATDMNATGMNATDMNADDDDDDNTTNDDDQQRDVIVWRLPIGGVGFSGGCRYLPAASFLVHQLELAMRVLAPFRRSTRTWPRAGTTIMHDNTHERRGESDCGEYRLE